MIAVTADQVERLRAEYAVRRASYTPFGPMAELEWRIVLAARAELRHAEEALNAPGTREDRGPADDEEVLFPETG